MFEQDMIGRRSQSVLFFLFFFLMYSASMMRCISPAARKENNIVQGLHTVLRSLQSGFQNRIFEFSVPVGKYAEGVKGNQVQILSDPVTVNGETAARRHCAYRMRRRSQGR